MPGNAKNRRVVSLRRGAHRRWWNTLAFRLGLIVDITVVTVLAVSAWVDYRRDADARIQHVLTRLQK